MALDWNDNEAEWGSRSSSLVASIKVSSISEPLSVNSMDSVHWVTRRSTPSNIVQLDGAADSSESDCEKVAVQLKVEPLTDNEPVKCRRCRRSYRTWQSFNKHAETCIELLSSSSSAAEEGSDDEIAPAVVQPKQEPQEMLLQQSAGETCPIQVPIVNSSSHNTCGQVSSNCGAAKSAASKDTPVRSIKRRQRRKAQPTPATSYRRPLAARLISVAPSSQLPVEAVTRQLSTYQLTLHAAPQAAPQTPLLYVTRPEVNGFVSPNAPQQQIYIIPQSLEQTFASTATMANSLTPAFNSSALASFAPSTLQTPTPTPLLQYFAGSDFMSALGYMNLTSVANIGMPALPTLPTLLQGQIHMPWEASVGGQIVYLPQQQLLFNPASAPVLPVAETNFIPLETARQSCDPVQVPPLVKCGGQEDSAPTPAKANQSAAAAFAALVESCCNSAATECEARPTVNERTAPPDPQRQPEPQAEQPPGPESGKVPGLEPPPPQKQPPEPGSEEEERTTQKGKKFPAEDFEEESVTLTDARPTKATYSYRLAMGTNRKNPRTIALLASSPELIEKWTSGDDPTSKNACDAQQLRIVAHSASPSPRTFRIKAVAAEDGRLAQHAGISRSVRDENENTVIKPIITTSDESSKQQSASVAESASKASEAPEAAQVHHMIQQENVLSEKHQPHTGDSGGNTGGGQRLKKAHIVYELVSEDGFYAKSPSLSGVWRKLLDSVQGARLAYKLEPLMCAADIGADSDRAYRMVGIGHSALKYLLEQLPDSDRCSDYSFQYHVPRKESVESSSSTSLLVGCARLTPFGQRKYRCDVFNWLASEYRTPPESVATESSSSSSPETWQSASSSSIGCRRAMNIELQPMALRFKNLRKTVKHSVGVYRSKIHDRGLFSKRDIEVIMNQFFFLHS